MENYEIQEMKDDLLLMGSTGDKLCKKAFIYINELEEKIVNLNSRLFEYEE